MSSVIVRDGREYAFTLAAGNRVTQTPIKTGRRHGAEVEVLGGLSETQAIVVSGGGFLDDGDLVKTDAAGASVAQTLL
jgi:multidrug efflux pump subunit AcrA (membrane-fusion protein)